MSKNAKSASIFDSAAPRLFSIDAGRPFLRDLCEALLDSLGQELSAAEIFLPTRRAIRTARETLLDAYLARGLNAAIMPRFRAIGDIDEDELITFAGTAEGEIELAPAIPATERLVVLAKFVAARERAFAGQENWPAAISAARELARLLDSFHTEEIDPAGLKSLDVRDAAGHWARSLAFLKVVTDEWPLYLEEAGYADPAARRARLISTMAARIAANPPGHPLIVAGTTASAPSVTRLVDAIARAPRGAAVLPGLDRKIDQRAWTAIGAEDAHPQSGMKALLDKIGLERNSVRAWPRSETVSPRNAFLTLSLRPAEATDDWLTLVEKLSQDDPRLAAATRGMMLIEADNEEAEASAIAAIFRIAIADVEKTAILVTPDRTLSRRVALKMRRWGVIVDDSAGVPFANTPCGSFLRILARHTEHPDDPVALLALLRHELAAFDLDLKSRSQAVDLIDRALRNCRGYNLLSALEASLGVHAVKTNGAEKIIEALNFVRQELPADPDAPFERLFDSHIIAAETIAGAERLWSGEDGAAGADLIAALRGAAGLIDAVAGKRYSDVFDALIADKAVRSVADAHPRLRILGPLEARLHTADLVILGGLNEGVWPQDAQVDPFLSRTMRKALGLPSPERRIGLSAHDFFELAAQEEVVMTRSLRAEGKPSKASRWIIRLKNILEGAGALSAVDQSARWRDIQSRLDMPKELTPAARPKPKAGPGRRPTALSVTRVEKWLRDPYGIYAASILGLKKLDDPGAEAGRREIGLALHKVFEQAALAETASNKTSLVEMFEKVAPLFGVTKAKRRFLSGAIDATFDWFSKFDTARRTKGSIAVAEGRGEITFDAFAPPFTLSAIADRIDLLHDGRASLFDYKTGRIPTEDQSKTFSPQLALTGLIIERGGFGQIGPRRVVGYQYLKALNRKQAQENDKGKEGDDARAAISDAEERIRALIAAYDSPDAVYQSQPRPEFTDDYGDYDQLARRREWGSVEGDDTE